MIMVPPINAQRNMNKKFYNPLFGEEKGFHLNRKKETYSLKKETYGLNHIKRFLSGDNYSSINEHINNLIQNNPIFTNCNMFEEQDEDGDYSVEYYVYYNEDIPYSQQKDLTKSLLRSIFKFCNNSGLDEEFDNLSLFLVKR